MVATLCQCQGLSAGPTRWSCQTVDSGCPVTPPAEGSSCPGSFNDCRYMGLGWALGCVCVGSPFNAWYCSLNADQPPAPGAPCQGLPFGYQSVTQLSPDHYQACSCDPAEKTWHCMPRDCPITKPSSNASCDGYQGLNCTYPGVTGSCVCEDVSNLWQCDVG
jgi:hypothetical protein